MHILISNLNAPCSFYAEVECRILPIRPKQTIDFYRKMLQGCTEFIAVEIHYNCQPNANNSLVAETMGVAESTACKEKKKKQHRQRRVTDCEVNTELGSISLREIVRS